MIKKDLEMPLRLKKLEVLVRRVPKEHHKFGIIESEYGKRLHGHKGEHSIKYQLSLLPDQTHHIFHNLRLQDTPNDHFFEIDTLLLFPNLLLLIESKNFRGELYFDHRFDQLIQTYEDTKKKYPSPLAQIQRHQTQLKRLLQANKFPPIPIESLLVITNNSTILDASPNNPYIKQIISSTNLSEKIQILQKRYKNEVLDVKESKRLSRLLLKHDTPFDENILEQFDLLQSDILRGVFCEGCNTLPMSRTQRKWVCASCGYSSVTAHLPAIRDYHHLFGNTITNQKLRDFILLPSRSASSRILKNLNTESYGEKKGKIYTLFGLD